MPYTEVCVRPTGLEFDIHAAAEPTTGGNCEPGDLGWIIERFEREDGAAATWARARLACLQSGMRLPEPFERQLSCEEHALFALTDMRDDQEWSSNETDLTAVPGLVSLVAPIMGAGSCYQMAQGSIGNTSSSFALVAYRCAK